MYNAKLKPISTPSNVSLINVTNGKKVIDIIDTEISGYDTTDKALINTNADINVTNATFSGNKSIEEIIKVTGNKTLTVDNVTFDDNETGKDLINVSKDFVADGIVEFTNNAVSGDLIKATNNITFNDEGTISDNSIKGSAIKTDKDVTISGEASFNC